MSLDKIREIFEVPAFVGIRVVYHCESGTDWYGTIKGAKNMLLKIDFAGSQTLSDRYHHPVDRISYEREMAK